MATSAIPTIGINGIRFRSRIEAQWAEFFTKLNWEWQYEPFDLKGYIPDFILMFPNRHILVEVKGDTNIKNIEQYADKIIKSGWDGEFLLVCSILPISKKDICGQRDSESLCIGILGRTKEKYANANGSDGISGAEEEIPNLPRADYDLAHFTFCNNCEKIIFCNLQNSSCWAWCRNCGHDGKELFNNPGVRDEEIYTYWYEAKNNSQWKK